MSVAEQQDDPRIALADWLISCRHDPLKFVLEAFPWGEPGELEKETGPDDWQREHLDYIGRQLRENPFTPILTLVVSGHGIGKSCDVSWLILWATMTAEDTKCVITANTGTQLKTKTWAELAKWFNLLPQLLQDQFEKTATALYARTPSRHQTWRAEAIPNSPENPAGFAGAHNAGKRLLMVMDEASEIDPKIWETCEGALTDADTEIIFAVYGNPTDPTGRFKECAEGRFRHRWKVWNIDSRNVKRTNKAVLDEMVRTYGEDSDFVRVRVLGKFPRVGAVQLIPSDVVAEARQRKPAHTPSMPLILGVDCARFGDDQSVLAPRRGLDAKTIPWRRYRGQDTMALVTAIVKFHQEFGFDAIMIDDGNFGAAVIDRLIQLNFRNVYAVTFSGEGSTVSYGTNLIKVANKRAEIWCKMRQWLYMGGAIPDEQDIEVDLTGTQYGYRKDDIQLERKEDMKKRGLASPDNGDALACTFAHHVEPRVLANPGIGSDRMQGPLPVVQAGDYDPYAELR